MKALIGCALMLIASAAALCAPGTVFAAEETTLPNGSKLQLGTPCPVCGMKIGGELESEAIYAYRHGKLRGFAGAAAAVFQNGKVVGFDGSRCLFTYNSMPKVYGVDVSKITHRYVTDFLSKKFIDLKDAYLVMGTKIRGFMGYDMVPFSSKQEAERFMTEHGGQRIITFQASGPEDVGPKGEKAQRPLHDPKAR